MATAVHKLTFLAMALSALPLGSSQEEFVTTDIPVWSQWHFNKLEITRRYAALAYLNWTPSEWVVLNKWQESARYLTIITGTLAMLGNVINIHVLVRMKISAVPHVYMVALAFCDWTIGFCITYRAIADEAILKSYEMHIISHYIYWPLAGLDASMCMAASLLAMTLSIDRCIALRFPLKYASICTLPRAKKLSAVCILLGLLIGIHYPLRLKLTMRMDVPHVALVHDFTALGSKDIVKNLCSNVEFLFSFGIPLPVMICSNILTLFLLKKVSKFRSSVTLNRTRKSHRTPKCLITTVGVIAIFFLTQIMWVVYLIDAMLFGNKHRFVIHYEVFIIVAKLIAKVNTVVNFFLYYLLWPEFKHQICKMITCLSREENETINTISK